MEKKGTDKEEVRALSFVPDTFAPPPMFNYRRARASAKEKEAAEWWCSAPLRDCD